MEFCSITTKDDLRSQWDRIITLSAEILGTCPTRISSYFARNPGAKTAFILNPEHSTLPDNISIGQHQTTPTFLNNLSRYCWLIHKHRTRALKVISLSKDGKHDGILQGLQPDQTTSNGSAAMGQSDKDSSKGKRQSNNLLRYFSSKTQSNNNSLQIHSDKDSITKAISDWRDSGCPHNSKHPHQLIAMIVNPGIASIQGTVMWPDVPGRSVLGRTSVFRRVDRALAGKIPFNGALEILSENEILIKNIHVTTMDYFSKADLKELIHSAPIIINPNGDPTGLHQDPKDILSVSLITTMAHSFDQIRIRYLSTRDSSPQVFITMKPELQPADFSDMTDEWWVIRCPEITPAKFVENVVDWRAKTTGDDMATILIVGRDGADEEAEKLTTEMRLVMDPRAHGQLSTYITTIPGRSLTYCFNSKIQKFNKERTTLHLSDEIFVWLSNELDRLRMTLEHPENYTSNSHIEKRLIDLTSLTSSIKDLVTAEQAKHLAPKFEDLRHHLNRTRQMKAMRNLSNCSNFSSGSSSSSGIVSNPSAPTSPRSMGKSENSQFEVTPTPIQPSLSLREAGFDIGRQIMMNQSPSIVPAPALPTPVPTLTTWASQGGATRITTPTRMPKNKMEGEELRKEIEDIRRLEAMYSMSTGYCTLGLKFAMRKEAAGLSPPRYPPAASPSSSPPAQTWIEPRHPTSKKTPANPPLPTITPFPTPTTPSPPPPASSPPTPPRKSTPPSDDSFDTDEFEAEKLAREEAEFKPRTWPIRVSDGKGGWKKIKTEDKPDSSIIYAGVNPNHPHQCCAVPEECCDVPKDEKTLRALYALHNPPTTPTPSATTTPDDPAHNSSNDSIQFIEEKKGGEKQKPAKKQEIPKKKKNNKKTKKQSIPEVSPEEEALLDTTQDSFDRALSELENVLPTDFFQAIRDDVLNGSDPASSPLHPPGTPEFPITIDADTTGDTLQIDLEDEDIFRPQASPQPPVTRCLDQKATEDECKVMRWFLKNRNPPEPIAQLLMRGLVRSVNGDISVFLAGDSDNHTDAGVRITSKQDSSQKKVRLAFPQFPLFSIQLTIRNSGKELAQMRTRTEMSGGSNDLNNKTSLVTLSCNFILNLSPISSYLHDALSTIPTRDQEEDSNPFYQLPYIYHSNLSMTYRNKTRQTFTNPLSFLFSFTSNFLIILLSICIRIITNLVCTLRIPEQFVAEMTNEQPIILISFSSKPDPDELLGLLLHRKHQISCRLEGPAPKQEETKDKNYSQTNQNMTRHYSKNHQSPSLFILR